MSTGNEKRYLINEVPASERDIAELAKQFSDQINSDELFTTSTGHRILENSGYHVYIFCSKCGYHYTPYIGHACEYEIESARKEHKRLCKVAKDKNYKIGWVYYRLKEKYSLAMAQEIMPLKLSPYWINDNDHFRDNAFISGDGELSMQYGDPYEGCPWGNDYQ